MYFFSSNAFLISKEINADQYGHKYSSILLMDNIKFNFHMSLVKGIFFLSPIKSCVCVLDGTFMLFLNSRIIPL